MTVPDHLFLITYRRDTTASEVQDLGHDVEAAMATYRRYERDYCDREDVEVVLVGSQSLETLRQTHSSYFEGSPVLESLIASAG